MLRAATLGLIDFAQFDPWNPWWWVRFYAVLEELERQARLVSNQTQHNHWLAFVSNSRMTDDGWDASRVNARAALNGVLKSLYPWRAKEIGDAGTLTQQQQLVQSFRDTYGEPGDARYAAMQASLQHYFSQGSGKYGRLTPREKELERKKRRAASEAREAAA